MNLYYIILTILWVVLLSYSIIDLIFPHILKGRVILRVQNEELGRRIWRSLFWVFFLVINALIIPDFNINIYSIFTIVFCILQIIRENRLIEIREKGMYLNFNFYKFKKMLSYTWKSKNLLELHLKNNIAYCNLEVKDDDMALKVDEVLHRYVKQE